ncbi:misato -like protein [Brachionus plicatilis]|uniref:Misato-like protein n=1 Tax=Brachionus plicatilis TaxID=10195 RepID=A0A3M7SEH3_BRAPC|nr:misato -like protein [Brachionus plicatilis]
MSHEVITFQFGNYSNYIGTHYWNIQQSQFVYSSEINTKAIPDVNHDILFREGLNSQKKATYSPRVILFDLKDNINEYKSVERPGNVEKEKEKITTWNGDLKVFESEKKPVSAYSIDQELNELAEENWEKSKGHPNEPVSHLKKHYDMDEQVKYWSDYSNVKYNDRSYMLVNQYDTATIETEPFDLFNYGTNIFSENSFMDDFDDNVRHYAEECDNVQGFQFFVDCFNGFGGMSCKALTSINEEYPKLPLFSFLSFPFYDTQKVEDNTLKLLNTALTLRGLLSEKSENIVVPLSLFDSFYSSKELNPISLSNVNYKPQLEYHTSAIMASVIDSITLPWRQRSQKSSMHDIVDLMDVYKYKIASVQSIFPLNTGHKYLLNFLQQSDLFKTSSWLTPFCLENSAKNADSNVPGALTISCRGVPNKLVKNPNDDYYFKGLVSAHSVLDQYASDMCPKSRSKCFSIDTPLNVDLPYPDIVETYGQKKDISLLTILQLNKSIIGLINFINNNVDKVNLKRQTKYFENGFEYDDFLELKAFNRDLADMYSA